MSREIKFRAWDKKNRQWIYAALADINVGMGSLLQAMADDRVEEVDRYTGLKDKNGVEIYEGDIVESVAFKDYVIFADGMFTLRRSGKSVNISNFTTEKQYQPLHWLEPVEVIGNIYENPGLLTQEETIHGN